MLIWCIVLKKKIYTYLQLIRLPNIFSSLADSSAGYLVVADSIDIPVLICLSLVSACIYAAGCVLNDYCDIEKDQRERPERPIPSGRASKSEALFLFCTLSIVSLILSAYAGIRTFFTAFILVMMVIVYSRITKERPVAGPVNMALCRAVNLFLGMTAVAHVSILGLFFVLISFLYVLSLTVLSDYEMTGTPGKKIWFVSSGLTGVLCILIFMGITQFIKKDSLLYTLIFIIFIGPPFIRMLKNIKPAAIGQAIKYLVLGIPVLDAVYVAGVQNWIYAVPVAACALVSIIAAKFFYVT